MGFPSLSVSNRLSGLPGLLLIGLLALGACAPTTAGMQSRAKAPVSDKFKQDREAILAMAGDFEVTFDFTETVPLAAGYKLKDQKVTPAQEMVRVIADDGDYISLQHILVVGGPEGALIPIKHWRQDWIYEPRSYPAFVGRNVWERRSVSMKARKGKWAQIVYQVDDAPRYAALGRWVHEYGISTWTPPRSWRPLPRRDATTRDDYDAIVAVNRHAITPEGWVHEQDNSKLVLDEDEPYFLVREVGVNTYRRTDDVDFSAAEAYWDKTADFWAGIRAEWNKIVRENRRFGLTIQGEPEALYMPILAEATAVAEGEKDTEEALSEAIDVIDEFVTTTP